MIGHSPRRRWLLGGVLAVAVTTAAWAGYSAYERHQADLALQQLIDEGCSACTLRHQAQLRLRDLLRQERADEAAAPPSASSSNPE